MIRSTRQAKIFELINERDIETQEDLAKLLVASGYNVTQATVSRDIKELGLIKALSEKGVYRYVTIKGAELKVSAKLLNLLRETVISTSVALNQVIIRTLEGSANAVSGIIAQLAIDGILGKIEGYDTLLIIAASEYDAKLIRQRIEDTLR